MKIIYDSKKALYKHFELSHFYYNLYNYLLDN